jgi:hypothetical protein
MACPNFKNGPKKGLGPLGVNTLFELTATSKEIVGDIEAYIKKLTYVRFICQ